MPILSQLFWAISALYNATCAFVFGGGESSLREAIWVVEGLNAKVISIDYRQPPLHDYSDVLEDTVAVWTEILKTQDAAKTAMFGSSAGGNITLATMHKLEELGLEIPGAIFVGTPSSDLSVKKDTWHTLEGLDPLGKREGLIDATFDLYAPKGNFTGPLVSPIYGDVTGFPPTILISGTRDLLLRFECIVN